ncbi:hypothetical protein RND81_13G068100 [Saponaria officinalis]|uniref:Protein FAR1-RELATED SEQUENCE n=1 Tax=Saponaria officinalis TaxID=3572 RepID=A0AAW1GUK5_SAPOF
MQKNAKVNLGPEGTFTFSGTEGAENHDYELKLDFCDGQCREKEEKKWRNRLLREGKPPHYMKVDWDKWVDEDDDTGGEDMTSNEIPSTPLARQPTVEKHTPYILLSYSPKGSQQWIRKVEEEFTPRLGMEFDTLEDGIQFYRIYAIACGFDVRKSTQRRFRDNIIRTKIILCHREGFGESKKLKKLVNSEIAETSKRKEKVTTIKRFGCTTMIKFVFKSGKYVICASLLDFKNFQREVKLFIGDANAEMFINKLEKLVHSKKGFQYAYHVDEGRNLCRVFWTDAHGKAAYLAFGDGVSFDPTYGTYKYCMVFTPFTGIDNHKKSVTFACALLSNEDEESFGWVFQKFMEAMGRKEPQLIITDQDPAIKKRSASCFQNSKALVLHVAHNEQGYR